MDLAFPIFSVPGAELSREQLLEAFAEISVNEDNPYYLTFYDGVKSG